MAPEAFEPYPYNKLSALQIRLFRLDLDGEDAQLSGVLVTVSLPEPAITEEAAPFPADDVFFSAGEGHEGYDALSYTWGSDELIHSLRLKRFSTTMFVEEEHRRLCGPSGGIQAEGLINISPNLRAFLTQRRKDRDSRWIWIDQICIQQTTARSRGNGEFHTQAPLMSEIYSRARCVLVWLGEADSKEVEALEQLPMLTESVQRWDRARNSRAPREAQALESRSGWIDLDDRFPVWQGASSILNKPWFERLWVLQEFALARSCTIVLGSCRRPFVQLTYLVSAFKAAGEIHWIKAIAHQRDTSELLERHPFSKAIDCSDFFHNHGRRMTLPMLFILAQGRKVGREQDMVFGLMGLMTPRCRKRVSRLDGGCSVRDVYLLFGRMSIEENEHPEECVLNHTTRMADSPSPAPDLPSWCPNLRRSAVLWYFADAGLTLGMAKQLFEHWVGFSAGFDLADPKWTPERKSLTESEFAFSASSRQRREIYTRNGPRQLRVVEGGLLQAFGVEVDRAEMVHVYSGHVKSDSSHDQLETLWR